MSNKKRANINDAIKPEIIPGTNPEIICVCMKTHIGLTSFIVCSYSVINIFSHFKDPPFYI